MSLEVEELGKPGVYLSTNAMIKLAKTVKINFFEL